MRIPAVIAITGCLVAGAHAQQPVTYDKSIELAAARAAARKMGDLRGPIYEHDRSLFVTAEDVAPPPALPVPRARRTPPVSQLRPPAPNSPDGGLDVVVTGSNRPGSPTQAPDPIAIGQSLLEALKLNPYPSD